VLSQVDSREKSKSSAIETVSNDDILKNANGNLQENAVQLAAERQTYLMEMSGEVALGISPNDNANCHHEMERKGSAIVHLK
jgi:hypothetical protein